MEPLLLAFPARNGVGGRKGREGIISRERLPPARHVDMENAIRATRILDKDAVQGINVEATSSAVEVRIKAARGRDLDDSAVNIGGVAQYEGKDDL